LSDEQDRRRVGLNEAIFRQVNEQIEKLTERFDATAQRMTVVCECADGGCTAQIGVTVSEYEQVRSDGRRFLVMPGHELPEVEEIVDEHDGYRVVRKREGPPGDVAERTDPR
jgi:hypothetical protein